MSSDGRWKENWFNFMRQIVSEKRFISQTFFHRAPLTTACHLKYGESMRKIGISFLIGLSLSWICLMANERIPDIVTFQNELYHLRNAFPLDSYLSNYRLFPKYSDGPMLVTIRGQMDGTDNPNFHIATWLVRNNRLYLISMEGFVYPDFNAWYLESLEKSLEQAKSPTDRLRLQEELSELKPRVTNRMVKAAMDYFFPAFPRGKPVPADWFSGQLILESQALSAFPSKYPKRFELIFNQGILQNIRRL